MCGMQHINDNFDIACGNDEVGVPSSGEFVREYKLRVNNTKSTFGDPKALASSVLTRPIDYKKGW